MKKLLIFTCTVCSLFSCKEETTKEEQPTTVKTVKAIESPKGTTRSYTFISRPYRVTELSFRVGGPVKTFDVQNVLNVKDVARIELFGVQTRTIDISIKPNLMTSCGVTINDIATAFDRQNRILDAGAMETDKNRIRVQSTGSFNSTEEIENLTVSNSKGEYFRLGEIADWYSHFHCVGRQCGRNGETDIRTHGGNEKLTSRRFQDRYPLRPGTRIRRG